MAETIEIWRIGRLIPPESGLVIPSGPEYYRWFDRKTGSGVEMPKFRILTRCGEVADSASFAWTPLPAVPAGRFGPTVANIWANGRWPSSRSRRIYRGCSIG